MRVGALQDCPELVMTDRTPRVTAAARSASGSTMLGDLPPSSWLTRLIVSAAARATAAPAAVEPVKDTMSSPGCDEIAAPTVGPSPITMLNTPAGTPAASRISAWMMALKGVNSDGFKTIVQPAASAGATLHMTWFVDQFHGVISPQTPTGTWRISVVPRRSSNSKSRIAASVVCRWASPAVAWAAFDSRAGAPISSVIVAASSSTRCS